MTERGNIIKKEDRQGTKGERGGKVDDTEGKEGAGEKGKRKEKDGKTKE